MGMLENVRAQRTGDGAESLLVLPGDEDFQEPRRQSNPLDSQENLKRHQQLLGWVDYERRRQAANRMDMALDNDYYDSIQFTPQDLQELADRDQAALVYNLVKRTADWVIGTEKRTRFDFKVLGRTNDDVESARVKTDAMKYFQDVNRTPFHRSQAFREATISGVGWLEDGIRGDSDEEPIYSTNESWWYTLHDSHAMKLDNTDARYHFRWRYVDQDVAEAMFPGREQFVRSDTVAGAYMDDEKLADQFYLGNRLSGEDYLAGRTQQRTGWIGQGFVDSTRERVKLYEGWFKMPVREKTMRARAAPKLHGLAYDPRDEEMQHAIVMGDASLTERLNMRVFYAVFTESGILAMGRSPYRHNEFPYTPVWCYRRGRDNAPYGMIRGIRDPQDGFNRRMAKTIFALSAYRVTADSDAIDEKRQSWEELRREAGRPDALIVKKKGTEIKVEQDRDLADAHLRLAQTEGSLILDASGVTADNLGLDSNAQSGKAILAKQAEGSAVTAEIFDNYRLACQLQGEKQLSLIEQFVPDERVLRVTDSKGRPNYKKVNEIVRNEDGTVRVLNDITATKADFVIDQQDFHTTMRQAASEALMGALDKVGGLDPKMTLRILRMAIQVSDYPDKDDLVKEIDQITGYKDPEAALTAQEKEEQARAQEQQAEAERIQKEQQQRAFDAELNAKLADAEKKKAEAERARADAAEKLDEIRQRSLQPAAPVTDPAIEQQRQGELDAASQQLAKANETIAALQLEAKNRAAEVDAQRYRADREYQAKVDVAGRQFPPPPPAMNPERDEQLADVMQDVQQLQITVETLAKGLMETEAEKSRADQDITEAASSLQAATEQASKAIADAATQAAGVLSQIAEQAVAKLEATATPKKPAEKPEKARPRRRRVRFQDGQSVDIEDLD